MAFQFHSTVFGQLMRLLSRNRLFRYADEVDPSTWKKATEKFDEAQVGQSHEISETPEILLVDWYGLNDPENPQNWSMTHKHLITLQLCFLNFAVYLASSIFVPGEPSIMAEFHVSDTVATLGLSLFTIGYGLGPMVWSPLSEMPRLGRTNIFFFTLLAFVVFQLAVGFAPNMPVFLFFRWLTGFFGSPCLSTVGGVITDMYSPMQVPFLLCIWASAGVMGPVFGPIIGGFLAPSKGWRWTIWVFTWACSAVLISMFFFVPETSAPKILLERAARLRKTTGNTRFRSQSEIDAAHYTTRDHLLVLARAFTLTFGEPIVLAINLYAGLLYGVLFTWFESFPLVFGGIYGFSSGEQGLAFLGIFVVTIIALPLFLLWIKISLTPRFASGDFKPEMLLPPIFVGCFSLPVCLFWFGWTSRADIHWIVPIIGSGFFSIGVVTLFNSLYNYLGVSYAQYAASVFAGAALFRASFGATFPLFARDLFSKLGIGPGNSLLGGIAACFIPASFIFYRYGERIRHMSKNARKDV
ncbi:major facilitator superfamily domain-containing protein [Mycena sanguinolenta]|nr:major facilitator superfamily domain-containing protein [Mycena sanguinolenta]